MDNENADATDALAIGQENELGPGKPIFGTRKKVFYGDPGATKLCQQFDNVSGQFLQALCDPSHPMLKVIPKQDLVEMFATIAKHLEFRAKLDWAKEQYYEVGSGQQAASKTSVFIGGGFSGEQVAVYE